MKRGTRLFLLAGCALVLALEGPRTVDGLAAGWYGPYGPVVETRTAALGRPAGPALRAPPAALLAGVARP